MIFRFADPHFLWLLLLLPLCWFLRGKVGRSAAIRFPSTLLAAQISAFVRQRPGRWSGILRWLALAAAIIAFARPQTGEEFSRTTSSGVDMMIAVDLSTSMWAHDFEINGVPRDRLTVVRSVLEQFIEARPNDRMGLIAFAAEPYLVSPLTLNHDWLLRRLKDLRLGQIEDGTAIGSAIGSATNRLRDLEAQSRSIVLVTDGANNRGQLDPMVAAEVAKTLDIKIYTIGVGRPGSVPYPVRFDATGNPVRTRDGQILLRPIPSDIDLPTLQSIAEMTDGRYFHATDLDSLREIYAEIDLMEKSEVEMEVRRLYTDVYPYPLAVALLFLAIELTLLLTRSRRLPS